MPRDADIELSIVVPAFNEATRIEASLERIVTVVSALVTSFEVLVVDDGSHDGTRALVETFAARDPHVAVFQYRQNRGKGFAVRKGVLASRGEWVLVTDADLSTPIEEAASLLADARSSGADVIVGSRNLPGHEPAARQSPLRVAMGWTFSRVVRGLKLTSVHDSQCGFKLFSQRAAQEIFERVNLDGFAFDVEVLLLARESGFTVREVAVAWSHVGRSSVSPLRDAPRMLRDVLALRFFRRSSPST